MASGDQLDDALELRQLLIGGGVVRLLCLQNGHGHAEMPRIPRGQLRATEPKEVLFDDGHAALLLHQLHQRGLTL